jgi:hypothetical protein
MMEVASFLKYVDLYLTSERGRFYVGHPVVCVTKNEFRCIAEHTFGNDVDVHSDIGPSFTNRMYMTLRRNYESLEKLLNSFFF